MYASWAQKLSNAGTQTGRQHVLSDVKKGLRDRVPSKADFAAGFKDLRNSDEYTKQRKLVKYILARIDQHFARNGVAADYEQMTIEHVAPQNPAAGAPSVSADKVAMIGNQLVCDVTLQHKLKNKPFTEKRKLLKKLATAADIVDKPCWGDVEIEERSERLTEIAYDDIWSF